MRFTIEDNFGQQAKQQTTSFNFGQPQLQERSFNFHQERSFNFGSSTTNTGYKFSETETIVPSTFSFGSTVPAFGVQTNTPASSFSDGAFSSSRFSFGNRDTNLFGVTTNTISTGFSIKTSSSATTSGFDIGIKTSIGTKTTELKFGSTTAVEFGFGTATATSTNERYSFGNTIATTTNERFSFGNTVATNTNERFSFGNAAATTTNKRFCFGNAAAATTNERFGFGNATATTTNKKFYFGKAIIPTNNERFCFEKTANVTSGFTPIAQQSSEFQFNISNEGPMKFASSSASLNFKANSFSSMQSSGKFNVTSDMRTVKFDASTDTNLDSTPLTRKQCLFLGEFEKISLEELMWKYCNSNRKYYNTVSDLSFKNATTSVPFSSAFQLPYDTTDITENQRSLFDQTDQNQTVSISLTSSNIEGTAYPPEQVPNTPNPNFEDLKFRSKVCDSHHISPITLIANLTECLGMQEASIGKNAAFDSFIATMIISKIISIHEFLDMIPGDVTLDDLRTHLIRAVTKIDYGALSRIFDEEAEYITSNIKQEQDIDYAEFPFADETKKEKQLAKLSATTSSKVINLDIVLPNRKVLRKKFITDTPLSLLLTCIALLGYPASDYKVLVYRTHQDLTTLNKNKSLEELKLYPFARLRVVKR